MVHDEVVVMATACVVNVNDIGVLLAEYLKSQGMIEHYYVTCGRVCMEFNGKLTISFDDYLKVHPLRHQIERLEARIKIERDKFNHRVLSEIIRTLRAGEVLEFIPRERIVVKATEKTETICIRVTKEEKQRLEEEAEKLGLTLSEYIRSRLH